jgi:hypothetical protein
MSTLRFTVELFHLDCPKVLTRGAPQPKLRAEPERTGVNPIFVCPRCKIKIVISPQVRQGA